MTGEQENIHVLLIEDDEEDALLAKKLLARKDGCRFEVERAPTLADGIAMLRDDTDAVLLDLSLPDAHGWETFTQFHRAASRIPIILLTGNADEELGMRAIHEGAQDYILKSDLARTVLHRSIRYAIERKNIEETLYQVAVELRDKNIQKNEELELARDMQRAFLPQQYPRFPAAAGPEESVLQFAHVYRPSRQLGGDFFDIRALSDVAASVFICDVMGHGVRSALVTATVRGLLTGAELMARGPGEVLTELNHTLRVVTKRPGQLVFSTAACLLIDIEKMEASYAVAGHPAPVRVSADGACAWLGLDGKPVEPALGLFPDQRYTEFRCPLSSGDRLVLVTDGLYETEGADGGQFGKQRFLDSAAQHSGLALPDLVTAMVKDVSLFCGQEDFDDDVCVVGVGIR